MAPKNLGGRPPHVPTLEQRNSVVFWTANGLTNSQIAGNLKIAEHTLRKHYKVELEEGFSRTTAFVTGKLMQLIQAGHPAAIFFWLKTRARWTERHEVTGANGNPIATLGGLTDQQLDQLMAALEASLPADADAGRDTEAEAAS